MAQFGGLLIKLPGVSIAFEILGTKKGRFKSIRRHFNLDDFTPYGPWTSLPPELINSLPTFWLNVTSSSHDSVLYLKFLKLFSCQTIGVYLSLL